MRSVEQEYKRLNDTVMPDEQLIARTRELMQAELLEKPKRKFNKPLLYRIASYVAVAAASALICVGVMSALPGAKTESAMEGIAEEEYAADIMVEESIEEEAVAQDSLSDTERFEGQMQEAGNASSVEYADIMIYYVEGGQVEGFLAEDLECSVDAIVQLWAQKNGVQDVSINSLDIQNGGDSMGVYLDLGGNVAAQLDDDGLMSAALSMTLGEYFNADGVILTCDGEPM